MVKGGSKILDEPFGVVWEFSGPLVRASHCGFPYVGLHLEHRETLRNFILPDHDRLRRDDDQGRFVRTFSEIHPGSHYQSRET